MCCCCRVARVATEVAEYGAPGAEWAQVAARAAPRNYIERHQVLRPDTSRSICKYYPLQGLL
jgi:hypothetical protein